MISSRFFFALVLISAAVTATGCSNEHPNIVPVSGKVFIDGQSLTSGQVTIYPEGHRAAVGKINENGEFTMTCFDPSDGVPRGTHLATVTAVESLSETSNRWSAPKEYASRAGSNLWVTIEGPTKEIQLDLTWKVSSHDGPFVENF